MGENKVWNRILTIILVVSALFFILSFTIIIPCTVRQFYICQIDKINAVSEVNYYTEKFYGFSVGKQDIIDAFNSVMDYIWKGIPFKADPNNPGGYLTGLLPLSANAEAHFHDCIFLFWLDLIVCVVTGVILIALLILRITKQFKPVKIFTLSPLFLSGVLLLLFVLIVVVYGLIVGFYELFITFHYVVFPGKGPDDWMFSCDKDVVVNLLTEDFWFSCAVYIGAVCGTLTIGCIVFSIVQKILTKKKQNKNPILSE